MVTILQSTAYSQDMLDHFLGNEGAIIRGLSQRKPRFEATEETIDGNPVVKLPDRVQEMIIETHRKLALALYYKICGKILESERRMAFSFFNGTNLDLVEKSLRQMSGLPTDRSMGQAKIRKQFMYKYQMFPADEAGFDLNLATFIHGLICFTTFLNSDDDATGRFRNILRSPFEPVA
ncbi:MAG: hypothetical protein NXI02_03095 [Rhodobacteraceae bacterium]|nr:hypothetical protein [Paracoccaceae bacterium]